MASSSNEQNSARGSGFVHLNTPAAIQYTAGQTLSLSALRQRKSRVECVTLPESQAMWRRAFQRYAAEEGYGSYAADVEDERSGNGMVLPSLVPQRSGPQRRRAHDAVSTFDSFFCGPAVRDPTAAATANDTSDASPSASAVATAASSPSSSLGAGAATAQGAGGSAADGIRIVSHHKVAGRQQFVYPDHDGVLSAGVVPEIVVTAEDKAEEEAKRVYYISALDMAEEELAALEELQALWKSRARSHSFLGAQHRKAAQGSVDPLANDEVSNRQGRHAGADGGHPAKMRRVETNDVEFAEAETAVDDASTLERELAEAVRLADELLRFA